MFNSSQSTPFKNSVPLSLSPLNTSPYKRKRGQLDRHDQAGSESSNKYVSAVQASTNLLQNEVNEVVFSKLFDSGDVAVINSTTCKLKYFHSAHKSESSRTVSISWSPADSAPYSDVFDIGKGMNNSTDFICCSPSGSLTLVNIALDGSHSSTRHNIVLNQETEEVTSICHAGNVLLIGTSTEDIYLLRRKGKSVTADRLQRSQSVLLGLFQTGAMLMGITPSAGGRGLRVVKLIPVPMSHLLLSVGSASLTLWSEWTSPGREKVVWQHKVRSLLKTDIGSLEVSVDRLSVVDACLMHTEPGAAKAVLLVLSISREDEADRRGKLWLHTLEVVTPPDGRYSEGGAGPVSIMHRVLVSESVELPSGLRRREEEGEQQGDGSSTEVTGGSAAAPQICSLSPSWRVFIVWSSPSSEGNADLYLHCAQFDILNQDVVKRVTSAEEDPLEAVRATHGMHFGIVSSSVAAFSAVQGTDGVCVLLKDGQMIRVTPHLPDHHNQHHHQQQQQHVASSSTASALSSSSAIKDRYQVSQSRAVRASDPAASLLAMAQGEIGSSEGAVELRNVFSALAASEVLAVVSDVSLKIVNRSPSGQYWGTSSSRAGLTGLALTRYQMVHRLVEEKLEAHTRLLKVLDTTNVYSYEAVRVSLFSEHQQLLLCAGLSAAVQDNQQRLSTSTSLGGSSTSFLSAGLLPSAAVASEGFVDAFQEFSEHSIREALRVVSNGMDIAVRRLRGLSVEEIESQGLSVVDQFYSETSEIVNGIAAIATSLEELKSDLSGRGLLFHASFGVASLLLSALNVSTSGEGADSHLTSVLCHTKTRHSLLLIIDSVTLGVTNNSNSGTADSKAALPAGFSLLREGKRLKELCTLVLSSYAMEAAAVAFSDDSSRFSGRVSGSGEGGEHMSNEWKLEYHDAKTRCVLLLLHIRHAAAAFALSEQFLYPSGLMEAVELDPTALQPALENVVRHPHKGSALGTDSVNLTTACLLWLEENHRPWDILDLGFLSRDILDQFLQTRPHLAWMNHLRSSRYSEATCAAVAHTRDVPNKVKSQTLLSIAKLSAGLAHKTELTHHQASISASRPAASFATPSPHIARLSRSAGNTSAATPVVDREADQKQQLEDATLELNVNLATIRSLKLLKELWPSVINPLDTENRVSGPDLVKQIIKGLQQQQTASSEDDKLEGESLVRCFCIGVSLLSMELDVAERWNRSKSGLVSAALHEERAVAVQASLEGLLVSLWSGLIRVQTETWLDLSQRASLGLQEEQQVREQLLLYAAINGLLPDVSAKRVRESLVPLPATDGGRGGLLEAVLEGSKIGSIVWSREKGGGGKWVTSHEGGPRNDRVLHVVKVAVDMAWSDASEAVAADGQENSETLQQQQ